jgi:hypothetical protein
MTDALEQRASEGQGKMDETDRRSETPRRSPEYSVEQENLRATAEGEMASTDVAEAIARLKALRRTFGKAPLAEILASRHEGHKY